MYFYLVGRPFVLVLFLSEMQAETGFLHSYSPDEDDDHASKRLQPASLSQPHLSSSNICANNQRSNKDKPGEGDVALLYLKLSEKELLIFKLIRYLKSIFTLVLVNNIKNSNVIRSSL